MLADRLGWDFIDLDAEIEATEETTIAQLFESRGEPEFRRIEKEALKKVMRRVECGMPSVVALGEERLRSLSTGGCSRITESSSGWIVRSRLSNGELSKRIPDRWRATRTDSVDCMRNAALPTGLPTIVSMPIAKRSAWSIRFWGLHAGNKPALYQP